MLRMVQTHCGETCWHLHDTSASGLQGRQGAVDYSFMAAANLTVAAQVLFVMELKDLLKGNLPAVVGQLVDRSTLVFEHQPPGRRYIFGIGAGRDGLVVVCIPRPASGLPILHSGDPKPLGDPTTTSDGFQLLLHVLLASRDAHNYVSMMPPCVSLDGHDIRDLVLVDYLGGGTQMQAGLTGSTTVRGSQVWCAMCTSHAVQEVQVAIKTGSQEHIQHEVSWRYHHHVAAAAALYAFIIVSLWLQSFTLMQRCEFP